MMSKFDFVGKRKIFGAIALGIMVLGIVLNVILGTKLDIQFTGGSIIKYSYVGDVEEDAVREELEKITETTVDVEVNYDVYVAGEESTQNNLTASVSETDQLGTDIAVAMLAGLRPVSR